MIIIFPQSISHAFLVPSPLPPPLLTIKLEVRKSDVRSIGSKKLHFQQLIPVVSGVNGGGVSYP